MIYRREMFMARYYIGFDCGTMGTKTALYREDSVRMAEAYRENIISYPHPGRAEMDARGFVRNVEEGVRECLHKSGVNPMKTGSLSLPSSPTWTTVQGARPSG